MALSDSSPLITTIIPTYRRPRLLRRAIKSVMAQTYPHFRVCVYDNASGDETGAVVRKLAEADRRVEYHCRARNIGSFRNFAVAIQQVSTPFFSCLSDDDILLPEFFQKALVGFERYPDAVFSSLATIHVDNRGRVSSVPLIAWQEGLYAPPRGLQAILKYGHPEWTAILFRRGVVEKVGGLDEETSPPMDLDFELRIAASWPIVISKEAGAVFVSHQDSITRTQRLESLWMGWQKMISNLFEDESIPYDVRLHARKAMVKLFRSQCIPLGGVSYVANKDWGSAELAAAILRDHYHNRLQAMLLRSLSWVVRRLPPAYHLVSFSYVLRRLFKRMVRWRLQRHYGPYARLLVSKYGDDHRPDKTQEPVFELPYPAI